MPETPNILFVISDQQRPDFVGTSDVPVRTPNFDSLVERGVGFENAVCPSPLCGPSRIALATNTDYDNCPVDTNWNIPAGETTLYERLRDEAAYETIGVGDIEMIRSPYWGLDGDHQIESFGFSRGIEIPGKNAMLSTYEQHISNRANGYGSTYDPDRVPPEVDPEAGEPADAYTAFLEERGLIEAYLEDQYDRRRSDRPASQYSLTTPCPLPQDAYVDDWVGRHGLEYLQSAPTDRPWHLAVNFVGPHDPIDLTAEMHGWYRDPDVEFPDPVDPNGDLDRETHQEIRRNYAAMCENIDRWLGRYLDALEERGELEDTIVVYTSDHGELLGDHGGWGKGSPRQFSTGIPMAIAGPGIDAGGTVETPMSLIDLHPTFLEAAGLTADGDGLSLWPYLRGERDSHRDVVRSGLGDWRAVFDGRYRLVVGHDLGGLADSSGDAESPILLDYEADPDERRNVAAESPAVCRRLGSHLPAGYGEDW